MRTTNLLISALVVALVAAPIANAGTPSSDDGLSGVNASFTNAGRVQEVCFTSSYTPPVREDCVATKLGRLSDAKVVKDGIATHTSIITSGGSAVGPIPFLLAEQLVYVLVLQDTITIGGVVNTISCFAIFAESGVRSGLQTDETPGAHGLWGPLSQDFLLYTTCPRILDTWTPLPP